MVACLLASVCTPIFISYILLDRSYVTAEKKCTSSCRNPTIWGMVHDYICSYATAVTDK
jgi:hypothetical protein